MYKKISKSLEENYKFRFIYDTVKNNEMEKNNNSFISVSLSVQSTEYNWTQ